VKSGRAILDVLFPEVRAKLLQLLFTAPPKQQYVRELMGMTGLALHTVQDEPRKLSAISVLTSWSSGYHRFYRADRNHPLFPQLMRIVNLSERLPLTRQSVLHRQPASQSNKKRKRQRETAITVDRPIKWDLFSRK
jgi:hypothetical protein